MFFNFLKKIFMGFNLRQLLYLGFLVQIMFLVNQRLLSRDEEGPTAPSQVDQQKPVEPVSDYILRERYFTANTLARQFSSTYVSCSQKAVIVINCNVTDSASRDHIRSTWGQWISYHYVQERMARVRKTASFFPNIKLIFVLASASPNSTAKDINIFQPELIYDDIIYFPDIHDSYFNLTLKTLASFKVIEKFCRRAIYFLKADSDNFINIPRLALFISRHARIVYKVSFFAGWIFQNSEIWRIKNSKWYTPFSVQEDMNYVDYLSGSSYLFNRRSLYVVLRRARLLRWLFAWEDIVITGQLGQGARLIQLDDYLNPHETRITVCHAKSKLVVHHVNNSIKLDFWDLLNPRLPTSRESCANSTINTEFRYLESSFSTAELQ